MTPYPSFLPLARAVLVGLALVTVAAQAEPSDAPVTVREIIEIRDIGSIAVSPDGQSIAARVYGANLERNRIDLSWQVIPVAGNAPARRLAEGGDPIWGTNGPIEGSGADDPPIWSADSRWFYFRAAHAGSVQVWRTARDGSGTEQITHDEADVEDFGLEGDSLWFVGRAPRKDIFAAEAEEYDYGTLLDETVLTQRSIARTIDYRGRRAVVRRMGMRVQSLLGDWPERYKVLALSDHQIREATPDEAKRFAAEAARVANDAVFGPAVLFASGGQKSATRVRQPSQNAARARMPRDWLVWKEKGGVEHACPAVEAVGLVGHGPRLMAWRDDETILFTNRSLEGQGIYAWDLRDNAVKSLFFTDGAFGKDRHGGGIALLVGDEAIGVFSRPGIPPRLMAFSLVTGAERVLFDPNPHLSPERLGIAEHLVVQDEFGNRAAANLILPREREPGERLPLVITGYSAHGFLRGGSGDDVPEQLLAAAGIAAVCLNDSAQVEISAETEARHGGEIYTTNLRMEVSRSLHSALVKLLTNRGVVDPQRTALVGMSAGASSVLYILAHETSYRAAVITTQGYTDQITYWLNGALPAVHRRDPDGGYHYRPEFFERWSPAVRAQQFATPLLMLEPDSEFPSQMQLFSALKAHDKAVEMVIYPDETHIKIQPRHRLNVAERGVAWLRFWLQGWEDPEPTDAAQFARWRKMRPTPVAASASRPTLEASPAASPQKSP